MTAIIGWAHTRFGKLEGETVESLIGTVASDAIAKAKIDPADIDHVFLGTYNHGLSDQGFAAGLISMGVDALRHTPATRLENACATGSAAIHAALDKIEAKRARAVLVIGVEKMTDMATVHVGNALLKASYMAEESQIDGGFAGVFGQIAQAYFQANGDQSDALAYVAAKNHANGAQNPLAHVRKDLGFTFCNQPSEKNPLVAGPLRRTDCSLISDGAAALLIVDDELAADAGYAITFRAREQVNDVMAMSRRDKTWLEGCARAWAQAFEASGTTLDDLSFVETHDCFTIAEIMEYEAMGLAPRGKGALVAREGVTAADGKLPVNLSGGLKSKGHPIGATGVSMHVIAAMQLAGEFPGLQAKDPKLAGVFNMGGTGVTNYVSILERMA
ncbi:MAG: acetyl-CoA acetyltransferase [Pseudomonadota bacterium]